MLIGAGRRWRQEKMNTKYKIISQLASYMAGWVTRDSREWMKYLDMAGRLYKDMEQKHELLGK